MKEKSYIKTKMGSNRSFGLVFAFIFFIIGFWSIFDMVIKPWAILIGLSFLITSIIWPKFLQPLNVIWFKFGIMLGRIVSPLVLTVLFFLIVTPTGLIMRLFGNDLLSRKYNKNAKTYWVKRKQLMETMKNQF